MKLKFALGTIGYTLFALLTPISLNAQTLPYGTTRIPRTCPSLKNPKKGAPSIEQAKMYFMCDSEWESGTVGTGSIPSSLWLVDDLTLEVASRSRPFNQSDLSFMMVRDGARVGMDTTKPVYEIQGSFTRYICSDMSRGRRVGKNCVVSRYTNGAGICFKTTFDDWHCRMTGAKKTKISPGMPPPEKWNSVR
jgi:hypothetical protein